MDPKTSPTDTQIAVPATPKPEPFLGNKILLFLGIGVLGLLVILALIYKTYLSPQQKTLTLRRETAKQLSHTKKADQPYIDVGQQTLFVIGGYATDPSTRKNSATNSAEFYDINTYKWTFIPPMHMPHAAPAVTLYNNKIYVFGGYSDNTSNNMTTVEMFDPQTSQWTLKSPLLHGRAFAQALTIADKMYLLGGLDATGSEDNSMDIYSPLTDSWQRGTTIPYADPEYISPRCGTFQNKIYCPGLGDHSYTLEYDPTTNQWQSLATENRQYIGPSAWANNDDMRYGVKYHEPNTLYQYNPSTDVLQTTKVGNYIDNSYQGFRTVALIDTMYLIGGKFSAEPVPDVYVLNLQNPTSWQKTTPLHIGRLEPGVVLLPAVYSGPSATPTASASAQR